jgi:hypothetical protein
MGVEIVGNDVPASGQRRGREQALQEARIVLLGARVTDGADDLAGGNIEGRDQGLGAVADIFETVVAAASRRWRVKGPPGASEFGG